MRVQENILKEKVQEFLDEKLAELAPGADGSVAEKVFAIYNLFQDGIPPYSQANALIAKTIWACMKNPAPLFADAPKNSGIMTLNIQCEFRRQLLVYIWRQVPAELRDNKKEIFEKALETTRKIEIQLSVRNLRARWGSVAAFFVLGLVCAGLYLSNCLALGGLTPVGSLWGVAGGLLILGSAIAGAHTLYVSCRQKRSLRLFQHVEPTESTALISAGNIQMGSFQNDLFSEASLMRIATAKLTKACENNEDVTFQGDEESAALAVVAVAAAASL